MANRAGIIGSSPRVWGTRPVCSRTQESIRFIPACVGNSAVAWPAIGSRPVHPRVCGELPPLPPVLPPIGGSSPRVWGTPNRFEVQAVFLRFIPACVGNSNSIHDPRSPKTVHPRVCGELYRNQKDPRVRVGSSPRVWGTHPESRNRFRYRRFIPACVGNSSCWPLIGLRAPVHPRVCGELVSINFSDPYFPGSSPRVWGTRVIVALVMVVLRFIPACVGNSNQSGTVGTSYAVHPRVCGELFCT